ncbi:hypothetical protein HNP02_004207 [Mycobacterium sp. AZCC_0083]|nr:hypothetical protein [Mycobacterium sp. AZCC_0083]
MNGRYLKRGDGSTTTRPGIPVDPAVTRKLQRAEAARAGA